MLYIEVVKRGNPKGSHHKENEITDFFYITLQLLQILERWFTLGFEIIIHILT